MKIIPTIIRISLMICLLCFVYRETGTFTTIAFALIFIADELEGLNKYLINK